MPTMSPHPSIEAPFRTELVEVLETRIAPALFFLSGMSTEVFNAAGVSANDTASQMFAQSDIAVLLSKGDSLIFDEDNDQVFDAGETILVTVLGGKALVFATDLGTVPDGKFDASELTGLVVSDGFNARINTAVNGSIVTALDVNNIFTGGAVQASADITGLDITGGVAGNIFAGGSISNVAITGVVSGNLATGTAVNANAAHTVAPATSFNGGGKTFAIAAFTPAPGAHGGSISDVRLDHGAKNVLAGDGGNNDTGAPGRGGSIERVAITIGAGDPVAWLYAGDGGISNTSSGARGGSISGVTVRLTADTTDGITIEAGAGGRGSLAGKGGPGGAILNTTVVTSGDIGGAITLKGGAGGKAEDTGTGGAGGAITNTAVHLLGAAKTVQKLAIAAGPGGASDLGTGGAGGSLVELAVLTEAIIGDTASAATFDIGGGAGGTGKTRGGAGGAITGGEVFIRNDVKAQASQPALIHAGSGGALSAAATAKSIAGRGGAVSDFVLGHFADVTAGITLASGDGGAATPATAGRGGAGGALSASITGSGAASTDLILKAGAGGAAPNGSGNGGAGGSISKTTIHEVGTLKSLTVQAGAGAAANSAASGAGGAGGAIKTLRIITGDVTGAVTVQAGAGGNGAGGTSGAGGGISALIFQNTGSVAGGVQVLGGTGGASTGEGTGGAGGAISNSTLTNAGGAKSLVVAGGAGGSIATGGAGGNGGGILRLALNNHATLTDDGSIAAGAGGNGGTRSGAGGAGGIVSTLILQAFDSRLAVTAGAGGTSSADRGGAGGAIDGVSGAVELLTFTAGNGGASTSGAGGAGGRIRNIDLDAVGTFVRALIAGNGGNGSTAGAGGSVALVSIAGDIGDFTQNFGTTAMGGIFAGQAGKVGGVVNVTKNGAITGVEAARIAAMLAGTPDANALTTSNAVRKILRITTDQLGADIDGDGIVDVTEAPGANPPGYTLGNPLDTLLDGIVLVRSGGLGKVPTLPGVVTRFNVVEV